MDELERRSAVAAAYERYVPMLYRYAVRRLGSALAEDAVSETFLTAHANWAGYDPARGEVRPWLFGILTRMIAKHQRAELGRYRLLAGLPAAEPVDDVAERVAETVVADGARPALTAALRDLEPRDRDVLLLIAWADLTYPEVAAALGIPLGTVRSRLHRARRLLRTSLDRYEPVEMR